MNTGRQDYNPLQDFNQRRKCGASNTQKKLRADGGGEMGDGH